MKRPDNIQNVTIHESGSRVPPGQFLTDKFPVLTYGSEPNVDIESWKLRIFGLVDKEIELDWAQFSSLEWETVDADFHCVTQWSALDQTWEGVSLRNVLGLVQPAAEARFVMIHSYGGYTTNLPLDLVLEEGLFAHKHMGEPLGKSHGWPLRFVVPSIYGWKSAKWVNGIELMAADAPGFWELRGYHNDGDPWKEERFWPELTR